AIERLDLAADAFDHARRDRARDAVAAVDDDLELALDLDVVRDALDVLLRDVDHLQAAVAVDEARFGNARVQRLDRVLGQRLAAEHDLEAVVVRRIVAAGDRDARARIEVIAAEVDD